MTVSSTTSKVVINAEGETTFQTGFPFLTNADVTATLIDANGTETTWVEGTQYTLTGAGEVNGGTLTVITAPIDYTPGANTKLAIRRAPSATQDTELSPGGNLSTEVLEQALDRGVMIDQKLAEELDRAVKIPVEETVAGQLPSKTVRANKYLAFNSGGDPIASAGPVGDSNIPVNPFIHPLLNAGSEGAAQGAIGLGSAAVEDAEAGTGALARASNLGTAAALNAGSGSGDLLRTDGDGSSLTGVDGGLKNLAVFTSAGPTTWNKPAGLKRVLVYVVGAGGGGHGHASYTAAGGGGGGCAIKMIDAASLGVTEDLTIGSGGAGGYGSTSPIDGESSSFGIHCSATGGKAAALHAGGAGGIGVDGDLNLTGNGGGDRGTAAGGPGGGSFFGGGARGKEPNGGDNGANGGGGGGADVGGTGGTGGDGVVVVYEY